MRPALRRAAAVLPLTALAFGVLPGLNPLLAAPPDAKPVAPEITDLPVPVDPTPAPAGKGPQPPPGEGLRDSDVDAFRMVGVSWEGPGAAGAWVRVKTEAGWTEWTLLPGESAAPDPGSPDDVAAGGRSTTPPLWVGDGATGVEVRLDADRPSAVKDAQIHLIEPGDSAADPGRTRAGTASAAEQPGIITRAQWGADESLRLGQCPHGPSYARDQPRIVFVHHTAGSNDYTPSESASIVRGIYAYHVKSNGWCDLGYNFLVDKYGQVFEGRYGGMDRGVVGAHTVGFNNGSFGVSVLGNYTSATLPSVAQAAMSRVIGWKLSLSRTSPFSSTTMVSAGGGGTNGYPAGTSVTFSAVSAHRDTSPGKNLTADPGTIYGRLGEIRQDAAGYMAEKVWAVRDTPDTGPASTTAWYGGPDDTTLACDFTGSGRDTFVVYNRGFWAVRTEPGAGRPAAAFWYGDPSMRPVCGDWDGDGRDGIGVYDAYGSWWLRETPTPGAPDRRFPYGWGGATPVVGDWDGDGRDGIAVYDDGLWMARQTATAGIANAAVLQYGWDGATPVPGDWDGNGTDTLGVFFAGGWWVRDSLTPGEARRFEYGNWRNAPVVGSWTGSGPDGVAVTRRWP